MDISNTVIDWIPAIKVVRLKDMPTFIWATDQNDIMLKFLMVET